MSQPVNGSASSTSGGGAFLNLPAPRPGVLTLLSGGLDSAIMIGLAVDRGDPVTPLYIRQGFVWEDEEEAAVRSYLDALSRLAPGAIAPLLVSTLSAPRRFAGVWAVDAGTPAPGADSPDEAVYLPGRNLALLTQAAMEAYSQGLQRIQMGSLSGNPFPDATAAFFRSFEASVFEAMRWRLSVEAPLAHLTKTEALELGIRYPLDRTMSCIRPQRGMHCGVCNKCEERRRAFLRAGLPDPTRYRGVWKGEAD